MDHRLLSYYNQELQYLRQLGGEFARRFPKIAGRLGLEAFTCADPYVERLLESFAFLAARIQLKIDSEFPRFTEHLLSIAYPHYLAPTPSVAVVKLAPNYKQGVLNDGFHVPRGSVLRGNLGKDEQTACEYRTAHGVSLWPIELASVTHTSYVGDLGELSLRGKAPLRGALRLRFRTANGVPFCKLSMNDIALFLSGPEQMSMRMYELIFGGAQALLVRSPTGDDEPTIVVDQPVRPLGFEDEQALLPYGPRSFQGYRLLHEYFAMPSRFLFAELSGLLPGVARCKGTELEVIVLLDRHDSSIEAAVTPAHFEPFCTPAINLFPKRVDRIHLSNRAHQYHVVPDRTRPRDFEVHSLTEVIGLGTRNEIRRAFQPFYACRERSTQGQSFYTVHREARVASMREKRVGARSSYSGSEVFVALVDGNQGPFYSDLRQLAVDTLCTNRDLPLMMPVGAGATDFFLESGAPVESIRCIAGPSEPRPSSAWGSTSWRLVSHLLPNYLSITDSSDSQGAAGLREILHLYGDFGASEMRRQVDGVRSVTSSGIVRRLPIVERLAFGRGIEITVECDETAFEGGSAFLFASVLERFFAKYASINSFTATVLRSIQRGELMRWPARIGTRTAR
ncbi:MAG: type VI secretion system baseplate subunit TssF [Polyangiaceae bacterium]|nr:type VI secretion system baseplate subunit TssF [Polyangiaceae bacterium]